MPLRIWASSPGPLNSSEPGLGNRSGPAIEMSRQPLPERHSFLKAPLESSTSLRSGGQPPHPPLPLHVARRSLLDGVDPQAVQALAVAVEHREHQALAAVVAAEQGPQAFGSLEGPGGLGERLPDD